MCTPIHYTDAHQCAPVHHTSAHNCAPAQPTDVHWCAPVHPTGVPLERALNLLDRAPMRIYPVGRYARVCAYYWIAYACGAHTP
jgi:hypothetical protein